MKPELYVLLGRRAGSLRKRTTVRVRGGESGARELASFENTLGRPMPDYTILLIDYEPRSIERTRQPLVAAGFRVEIATDGLAGIEAFHRIKPSLVVVEAMIPKKHGFEVCQELKKTPLGKRTPILITTAVYKGRKYRSQALHIYGCDEYVEKPVADDQLVALCAKFLDAPVPEAPAMQPQGAAAPQVTKPIAPPTPPAPPRASVTATAPPPPAPSAPPAEAPMVGALTTEEEIMTRLDAILPSGTGSSEPWVSPAGMPHPSAPMAASASRSAPSHYPGPGRTTATPSVAEGGRPEAAATPAPDWGAEVEASIESTLGQHSQVIPFDAERSRRRHPDGRSPAPGNDPVAIPVSDLGSAAACAARTAPGEATVPLAVVAPAREKTIERARPAPPEPSEGPVFELPEPEKPHWLRWVLLAALLAGAAYLAFQHGWF